MCPSHDAALFRGVTVAASTTVLFRWLCQIRIAPYSYDWLDNGGRRSPPTLTPGLDVLVKGQRVMTIFDLVAFEPDRSIAAGCWPSFSCATRRGPWAGPCAAFCPWVIS